MVYRRYKYVFAAKDRKGQPIYWYFRWRGKVLARMPGRPGTPEFEERYSQLLRQLAAPGKRVITDITRFGGLCKSFVNSSDFKDLRLSTRTEYERYMNKLLLYLGEEIPVSQIDGPIVEALRDKYRDKPRSGNYLLQTLRRLLSYARRNGVVQVNAAAGFGALKMKPRRNLWQDEDVEAFVAACQRAGEPMMQLALWLALESGQRQGDLLAMTWSQYRDGALSFEQSKTGKRVAFDCPSTLRGELERAKSINEARPVPSVHVLTTASGKPFKADYFRHLWRRIALDAGLDGLTFMDLRRTAVTRLAEAGCDIPEIISITGHDIQSANTILETYLVRTRRTGNAAVVKLESAKQKRRSAKQP